MHITQLIAAKFLYIIEARSNAVMGHCCSRSLYSLELSVNSDTFVSLPFSITLLVMRAQLKQIMLSFAMDACE